MSEQKIIYSCVLPSFIKRFWNSFAYDFYFSVFAIVVVTFTINQYNVIHTIIYLIIAVFYFASPLYSAYKWANKQILQITVSGSQLFFLALNKDEQFSFIIDRKNIITKLKWEGNKPPVMKLSIYDQEKKIIEIFSAGKSKLEYELQLMVYEIDHLK